MNAPFKQATIQPWEQPFAPVSGILTVGGRFYDFVDFNNVIRTSNQLVVKSTERA